MKKTYEELQAECHAQGLMIGGAKPLSKAVDVDVMCAEHGITKEQWDAIPNAVDYWPHLKTESKR